jgi:hypothetical protein
VDVESVPIVGGLREQRVTPVGRYRGQHRTGAVGLRLGGEVDPGHAAMQEAAGEHGDVDVRRLEQTAGTGDRARFDGDDLVAAVPSASSYPQRAEPRKPSSCEPPPWPCRSANRLSGSACPDSIMWSGTGSPSPSKTVPLILTAAGVAAGTAYGPSGHGRPMAK